MSKLYVPDTNILLNGIESLQDYKLVLLSHTLRELEKHKNSKDSNLAYKARKTVRYIDNNRDKFVFDTNDYDGSKFGDNSYEDNRILSAISEQSYGLISNDILLTYRAEGLGIDVIRMDRDFDTDIKYTGIHEIYLTNSQEDQELLAYIYSSPESVGEKFDLVENQYLLVWDKTQATYDENGKIKGYQPIDQFRFDGEKLVKLKFKNIENSFTGRVKPLNVKQKLMFDMLQNKKLTLKATFGSFGVGKDFIMISHAIDMLNRGEIDKIVYVRNNIQVKDTNDIGFLPSDLNSKLLPFAMPLADHLGGQDGLDMFLRSGKIEIQHLGFLRGRDFKNTIVYCSEIQSSTTEHIQLLIGRIGENSQLWLNGDTRQIDSDKFKYDNGVIALKKLKGQRLYGQVTLDKTERSETARLADLLD